MFPFLLYNVDFFLFIASFCFFFSLCVSCVVLGYSWSSVKGLSARLNFSSFLLFGIFCGSAGEVSKNQQARLFKKEKKNIAKEKKK